MIENLFTTTIGSHLWSMEHANSDTDLFQVYVASTEDILKGTANLKSIFIQKDNVDTHKHEVGKVIEQLLKGNLNFLVGVVSPIVNACYAYEEPIGDGSCEYEMKLPLYELQKIVKENIAKNCYHSIHGLAVGNYKKYIESGLDNTPQRCAKVLRTLAFGITLLYTGKFEFAPKTGEDGAETIIRWLGGLEQAYKSSTLPEKPNEKPFREWLYNIRMVDLENGRKEY